MYDVIIFTDFTESHSGNYPAPIKSLGGYQIASVLRDTGLKVKVIDNFIWILENYTEEFFRWTDENIEGVKLIGFSTTFLQPLSVTNRNRKIRSQLGVKFSSKDVRPLFDKYLRKLNEWKTKQPMKIIVGGQGQQTAATVRLYDSIIDHWFKGLSEDILLTFLKNWEWDGHPKILESDSSGYDFHNHKPTFDKSDIIYSYESLPIEISRGCRFKCKFCSFPLLGRKPSPKWIRSEDSIYNELKHNYDTWGVTNYQIMDDTFNETTEKLRAVQRAIERTGISINFWAYTRIELLNAFPEQISILRDMGQKSAFFGIESLHDPSAKIIGKGLGREKISRVLEKVKESWGRDTDLHGSFIIGLPHETAETAEEWVQILINKEISLDSVSFNPLTLSSLSKKWMRGKYRDSKVFLSEFDRNAEKYGYERGSKIHQWKNEHWDYKEASAYAADAFKRIKDNADGLLTHDYLPHMFPMLNLGFSREEVNIGIFKGTEFRNEVKKRKLKLLDKYKEDILYGHI